MRDMLGATLVFNRERRYAKSHVEGAILRALQKFNMVGCRKLSTPSAPNSADESDKTPNTVFPIRSIVGVLQYLAVIARPDIMYSVQRVARQVSCPTDGTVKAAKRILAYLSGTPLIGIEYTVQTREISILCIGSLPKQAIVSWGTSLHFQIVIMQDVG